MELRVQVLRAVAAPVGARFVRSAVEACAAVAEVAARLPEGDLELAAPLLARAAPSSVVARTARVSAFASTLGYRSVRSAARKRAINRLA